MTWPMGLRLTCIAAPIQVEGPVDGGYVYFRARGDEWQLAIGRDQHEAVEAMIDGPWDPFCYIGDWPYAPDDYDAARAILREYLPKLRMTDESPQDVTYQEALGEGADPMEGFYDD